MLSFGSDPEFFLTENNAAIPAVGLIGGTKEKPFMYEGYGFQEDNVMGEFTVPVTTDPLVMPEIARHGARYLLDFVRTKHDRKFGILRKSHATFTDQVLASCGEQAMQFGCSPDFDAYRLGAQWERIDPALLRSKNGRHSRFAGGHVHIGYKEDAPDVPEYVMAMLCDLTIGAGLVVNGEAQGSRREWYGLPGRFRPTAYGLEYRTPSNQWLYRNDLSSALTCGLESLSSVVRAGDEYMVRLFNEVPWNDLKRGIATENRPLLLEMGAWLNRSYENLNLSYGGV